MLEESSMITIYPQKKLLPRFNQEGFILLVMLFLFMLESTVQVYYWRSEQQAAVLMGQLCGHAAGSCHWESHSR